MPRQGWLSDWAAARGTIPATPAPTCKARTTEHRMIHVERLCFGVAKVERFGFMPVIAF